MKSRIFSVVLLSAIAFYAFAGDKSDDIKPRWMHSVPIPSNNTFIYTVERSVASNLKEARENCLSSLLQDAGFEKGVTVTSDYKSHDEEHSVSVNGHSQDVSESHFIANSVIKGKEVQLQGMKIDEYWERRDDGRYYLTTLFARSQIDKTPDFDNVRLTTKYGMRGLWRSAIIPGWGQLYKGSTLKGGLILGGTALSVAAIIYTDCMRVDYNNKIGKTHNADNKREYANRRDNFETGRNICIGVLGALYIYNIVDAIVAPGARRILTSPSRGHRISYTICPGVTYDRDIGLCAEIRF